MTPPLLNELVSHSDVMKTESTLIKCLPLSPRLSYLNIF